MNNIPSNIAAELEQHGFREKIAGKLAFSQAVKAIYELGDAKANPISGLLISGECGVGKTFLARIILKILNCYDYHEISLGSGINGVKKLFDDESECNYYNVPLLLDDLGSEPQVNDYGVKHDVMSEFIFDWHARWVNATYRPLLIITTNLNAADVQDRYGVRTMSRLGEICMFWRMPGGDKRKFRVIGGVGL